MIFHLLCEMFLLKYYANEEIFRPHQTYTVTYRGVNFCCRWHLLQTLILLLCSSIQKVVVVREPGIIVFFFSLLRKTSRFHMINRVLSTCKCPENTKMSAYPPHFGPICANSKRMFSNPFLYVRPHFDFANQLL